jgi:hypothetical protein
MIYTQEQIIKELAIGDYLDNPNIKEKDYKLIKIKSFSKDLILAMFTINDELMLINYSDEVANKIYSIYNKQFPKFK